MTDLILWSVMLWAVVAILLHLGLIGYATICRNSNWWERPWAQRAERLRWGLAWIIGLLFLAALLTSCACKPSVPLERISPQTPTPTLGSVADLGIGIECVLRY